MLTLNQTEFAKRLGVSKGYVSQLKAADRLVFDEKGNVDVVASELRIKATEDPNRDDVVKRHAEERGKDTKVDEIGKEKKAKPARENNTGYQTAKATEQHYRALAAKLEYEKSIGQVVSMDDMKAAVGDVVTIFRQKLENLPHSLAADLVGKDMDFIRAELKQRFHNVLTDLSREFNEKIIAKEAESA